MREVCSLPTIPKKCWPLLLLIGLLITSALTSLVTTDVYYLCLGMSTFTGWLIMLDVDLNKLRIGLLAILAGSFSSCVLDAIAFEAPVWQRTFGHIIWSKVFLYACAAVVGIVLCALRHK